MEEYSLEMKGIVKQFPGVQALSGVDFNLRSGEVHALLGINGAGKSTLIKILAGVYQMDAGEINISGKPVEINSPLDAKLHGISTVYQDPQMIPSFSGFENIFLGMETNKKSVFDFIRRGELRKRAQQLLERYPFNLDLNKPVIEMGPVEKESIAILRALSQASATILVLDEPTSILTRSEILMLFEQIKMLKERGVSIIYITHRLEEVFRIADRFTVLRDGKTVGMYTVDENINTNKITELMLGEKLSQVYPDKVSRPGEEILSVEHLAIPGKFTDISFNVRRGEILGIYGLVGSGFDELCKSLFGILPDRQGKISLHGKAVEISSSEEAIRNGIFLVPGDRRTEGQVSEESVAFNLSLANLKKVSGFLGFIRGHKEGRDTSKMVDILNIKTPGIGEKVALLSGGNQQKVVIGKGLYTDADLYIFEEPTVGVDVGAKSGIYYLMRELSQDKAVMVVSSDIEEVYGVSDRILVMFKGQVVLDRLTDQTQLNDVLVHGLTGGANVKASETI